MIAATAHRAPQPSLKAKAPNTDIEPRCWNCGRMLGEELTRPWTLRCTKCKARNHREPDVTSQSS